MKNSWVCGNFHDELMMEESRCVSQISVQKPSHIIKACE
jgi:hypothetical protein